LFSSLSLSLSRSLFVHSGAPLELGYSRSDKQSNEKPTEAAWRCEPLTAFKVVKNVEIRNFRSDSKLSTPNMCESAARCMYVYVCTCVCAICMHVCVWACTAIIRIVFESLIDQKKIANGWQIIDLANATEYFNRFTSDRDREIPLNSLSNSLSCMLEITRRLRQIPSFARLASISRRAIYNRRKR